MIQPESTFDGTFPFAPHFTSAPRFQMHYADEGPRNGEVVLCLHGEPTWGYLFRSLVSALSATHRVVVPDHMGLERARRRPIAATGCRTTSIISRHSCSRSTSPTSRS